MGDFAITLLSVPSNEDDTRSILWNRGHPGTFRIFQQAYRLAEYHSKLDIMETGRLFSLHCTSQVQLPFHRKLVQPFFFGGG